MSVPNDNRVVTGRILIFAIKGFRWHKQVPSEAFLFTRVITGYEVTGTSWVRKDSFQSENKAQYYRVALYLILHLKSIYTLTTYENSAILY
jgi:hypothetical protein